MRRPLVILFLLAASASASAASPFRFERTVTPAALGPNRLDPDAALLTGARHLRYVETASGGDRMFAFAGGLEDLRLFDTNGREVPHLVIAPPEEKAEWKGGRVLPVAQTKFASGFELDLGSVSPVDRIRLTGIPAPFLKRARLEGSGDRVHWTLLAEATLFDLPDRDLRNVEIGFEAGPYRFLRVTWDDRSSARVTRIGDVSARISRQSGRQALPVEIPIHFQRRASEPGKSRYRLQLPGVGLPVTAIVIRTSDKNVFRDASVHESRLTGAEVIPAPLGTAKLRRAEKDGAVAETLFIPIAFPTGSDLEVVIDDGNNRPLEIDSFHARLAPLPWIYFDSAEGTPVTARYGNSNVSAPRYDLEASRDAVAKTRPPHAQWTQSAAAPLPAEAALEELPLGGAPIDESRFRYSRIIPDGPAGLTLLVLDIDVLSRSRCLCDLRIADGAGRQVPYVVERRDAPLATPLRVPSRERDDGRSRYRFELPYESLPPGTRLVITTNARVFDRHVSVRRVADERRGREAATIDNRNWSSTGAAVPPPLRIDAGMLGVGAVDVLVDEGDNAPLPIPSATLFVPSHALRFYRPAGPLTLVYGNDSLAAPKYDLTLLAPRLFSEPAHEVALRPERVKDRGETAPAVRRFFWIAVALAVLVLLGILGRLLGGRTAGVVE